MSSATSPIELLLACLLLALQFTTTLAQVQIAQTWAANSPQATQSFVGYQLSNPANPVVSSTLNGGQSMQWTVATGYVRTPNPTTFNITTIQFPQSDNQKQDAGSIQLQLLANNQTVVATGSYDSTNNVWTVIYPIMTFTAATDPTLCTSQNLCTITAKVSNTAANSISFASSYYTGSYAQYAVNNQQSANLGGYQMVAFNSDPTQAPEVFGVQQITQGSNIVLQLSSAQTPFNPAYTAGPSSSALQTQMNNGDQQFIQGLVFVSVIVIPQSADIAVSKWVLNGVQNGSTASGGTGFPFSFGLYSTVGALVLIGVFALSTCLCLVRRRRQYRALRAWQAAHPNAAPLPQHLIPRRGLALINYGVSEAELNKLPQSTYQTDSFPVETDASNEAIKPSCSICLAEYDAGEHLVELPCHHFFHAECGKKWLKRQGRCPLCQRTVNDQTINRMLNGGQSTDDQASETGSHDPGTELAVNIPSPTVQTAAGTPANVSHASLTATPTRTEAQTPPPATDDEQPTANTQSQWRPIQSTDASGPYTTSRPAATYTFGNRIAY